MSEFFAHRINKQSINQAFANSAFVVLGFSIPPPRYDRSVGSSPFTGLGSYGCDPGIEPARLI
jgi:hypothetical protein